MFFSRREGCLALHFETARIKNNSTNRSLLRAERAKMLGLFTCFGGKCLLGLHFVVEIITSTNMTSLPENFEPQLIAYFFGTAGCLAMHFKTGREKNDSTNQILLCSRSAGAKISSMYMFFSGERVA